MAPEPRGKARRNTSRDHAWAVGSDRIHAVCGHLVSERPPARASGMNRIDDEPSRVIRTEPGYAAAVGASISRYDPANVGIRATSRREVVSSSNCSQGRSHAIAL
jgi:hypothetical protein